MRHRGTVVAVLQQLRDAEVEQLDLSVAVDQDVGRLDVAMDNQVHMREGDGAHDLQEQLDSRGSVERSVIAVPIDRHAVDVFEYQERLPVRGHAGVEQLSDARMCQAAEDAAFSHEALLATAPDQGDVEELDGCAPLESAVGALGHPHRAHASLPEKRFHRVGAERLTLERRLVNGPLRFVVEKPIAHRLRVLLYQQLHFEGERGVAFAHGCQSLDAGSRQQIEHFAEQVVDGRPAIGVRVRHGAPQAGACPRIWRWM